MSKRNLPGLADTLHFPSVHDRQYVGRLGSCLLLLVGISVHQAAMGVPGRVAVGDGMTLLANIHHLVLLQARQPVLHTPAVVALDRIVL